MGECTQVQDFICVYVVHSGRFREVSVVSIETPLSWILKFITLIKVSWWSSHNLSHQNLISHIQKGTRSIDHFLFVKRSRTGGKKCKHAVSRLQWKLDYPDMPGPSPFRITTNLDNWFLILYTSICVLSICSVYLYSTLYIYTCTGNYMYFVAEYMYTV